MPLFAWIVSKITGEAIKSGTEVVRSAVEIPKTLVETERAKLEVVDLKRQIEERGKLIVPATFEDVKEFDEIFLAVERKERLRRRLASGGTIASAAALVFLLAGELIYSHPLPPGVVWGVVAGLVLLVLFLWIFSIFYYR